MTVSIIASSTSSYSIIMPTLGLRLRNGVLQQAFCVTSYAADGTPGETEYQWHDVPSITEPED